jgi:hypothetical protein
MNERHHHIRCDRISVPHVATCECGAILVSGRTEWEEPIWTPPPWEPPAPRSSPDDRRRTTPLPLVLADILAKACR